MYAEEAVVGGCACPERPFRLLLASQKQRNQASNQEWASPIIGAPQEAALPDLTPEMLLSPMGRGEFEAAQGEPVDLDDMLGLGRPRMERTASRGRPAPTLANVNLEEMWLNGTGIPYEPSEIPVVADDGFEFSSGEEDIDLGGPPIGPRTGGVRFRVDRAPSERGLVNDQRAMRQVNQVRNGRFALLAEDPAPRQEGTPVATIADRIATRTGVMRPPPRDITASDANARQSVMQQARVLQERAKRPTVYDRLRNNPIDD